MILAHEGLTDLGWIHPHVPDHPNLFFDTTWWGPSHLLALLALVPPGRILSGSDVPYYSPLSGALGTLCCLAHAGCGDEQVRLIMGGQFARLVAGEEPADGGPIPAGTHHPLPPMLEIVYAGLTAATEGMLRGEDPGNMLPITRHACKHPPGDEHAAVYAAVLELLDLYEANAEELPRESPFAPGWDLIAAAATVARTPRATTSGAARST